MKQKTPQETHLEFWGNQLKKMDALHRKKAHDYANAQDPHANFRVGEPIGIPAAMMCLLRCFEKDHRKKEVLIKGNAVEDESLQDSVFDDAVLSLLFIELWDEFKQHPHFQDIVNLFAEIKMLLEDKAGAIVKEDPPRNEGGKSI